MPRQFHDLGPSRTCAGFLRLVYCNSRSHVASRVLHPPDAVNIIANLVCLSSPGGFAASCSSSLHAATSATPFRDRLVPHLCLQRRGLSSDPCYHTPGRRPPRGQPTRWFFSQHHLFTKLLGFPNTIRFFGNHSSHMRMGVLGSRKPRALRFLNALTFSYMYIPRTHTVEGQMIR